MDQVLRMAEFYDPSSFDGLVLLPLKEYTCFYHSKNTSLATALTLADALPVLWASDLTELPGQLAQSLQYNTTQGNVTLQMLCNGSETHQ
jgi:hypothetical protein